MHKVSKKMLINKIRFNLSCDPKDNPCDYCRMMSFFRTICVTSKRWRCTNEKKINFSFNALLLEVKRFYSVKNIKKPIIFYCFYKISCLDLYLHLSG